MEGIDEVTVFPSSSRVRFVYDSHFTTSTEIEDRLRSLGFPPTKGYPSQPEPWRNPKVLTSLLSGVLLFSGWLFAWTDLPQEVSIISYVFAILIGGYYFGREAVEDLVFERRIGIELLMAVAAIVAAVMGLVSEGAILVFLYSISEAAEGYTEERARSAIKALMNLVPQTVLVRRNGEESEIPLEELQVEDVFIVRPGERVATDGEIVSGTSGVNQAPVTGESAPVEKAPGDTVFAASINGEGVLEIRATKTSADNTVARIIQMVEDAQERKGKSQRFIERFGSRYSPLVLLSGLLIALIPPITMGAAWSVWIERATVFIVAASPCALVISIPITLVATLGKAASNGVLFKGGIHIEQFSKVSVLAFDKTGTLTYGQPKVTDVVPVSDRILGDPNDKNRVLSVAAGVEAHSEHPLARAILTSAKDKGIEPVPSSEFRSLTGSGATA
ncbi:MAG: heavy metal translocating P-type ATPase, partial [Candidatus Omnitrophica bacterium]|nr:heavy metal translocating P-type ATPase [Candidatus Omnitrophota bacterium]